MKDHNYLEYSGLHLHLGPNPQVFTINQMGNVMRSIMSNLWWVSESHRKSVIVVEVFKA